MEKDIQTTLNMGSVCFESFCFTLVGVTVIIKIKRQQVFNKDLEKREPCPLLVRMFWKTVWRFLQKLKQICLVPRYLVLRVHSEELRVGSGRSTCSRIFLVPTTGKNPKCHIYAMGYCSATKKRRQFCRS